MAGNLLRVKDLGEVEVTVLSSVIWRGAGKEIVLVLRSPAFAGWRGLHKDELRVFRHGKERGLTTAVKASLEGPAALSASAERLTGVRLEET